MLSNQGKSKHGENFNWRMWNHRPITKSVATDTTSTSSRSSRRRTRSLPVHWVYTADKQAPTSSKTSKALLFMSSLSALFCEACYDLSSLVAKFSISVQESVSQSTVLRSIHRKKVTIERTTRNGDQYIQKDSFVTADAKLVIIIKILGCSKPRKPCSCQKNLEKRGHRTRAVKKMLCTYHVQNTKPTLFSVLPEARSTRDEVNVKLNNATNWNRRILPTYSQTPMTKMQKWNHGKVLLTETFKFSTTETHMAFAAKATCEQNMK